MNCDNGGLPGPVAAAIFLWAAAAVIRESWIWIRRKFIVRN